MSPGNTVEQLAAPRQSSTRTLRALSLGQQTSLDVLESILSASPVVALTRMDSLESALEAGGEAPVLVILPTPMKDLGDALMDGEVPSVALAAWITWATATMDQIGRVWRDVLCLDEMTLCRSPELLSAALAERLGIDAGHARPADSEDPAADFHTVLACHMLREDLTAHGLAGQLASIALGSDEVQRPGVEVLDRLARNPMQREPDPATPQGDTEETARLLANIAELRAEIEQHVLDRSLFEKSLEAGRAQAKAQQDLHEDREGVLGAKLLDFGRARDEAMRQKATAEEAHRAATGKIAALQAELDRTRAAMTGKVSALEAELDQTRSALTEKIGARGVELDQARAAATEKIGALEAELDQQRAALTGAQEELARLYASKSWKAVSAMRAVRHGWKK